MTAKAKKDFAARMAKARAARNKQTAPKQTAPKKTAPKKTAPKKTAPKASEIRPSAMGKPGPVKRSKSEAPTGENARKHRPLY